MKSEVFNEEIDFPKPKTGGSVKAQIQSSYHQGQLGENVTAGPLAKNSVQEPLIKGNSIV